MLFIFNLSTDCFEQAVVSCYLQFVWKYTKGQIRFAKRLFPLMKTFFSHMETVTRDAWKKADFRNIIKKTQMICLWSFKKAPWIQLSCILIDYRLNESNCGDQVKCFLLCSLSNKELTKIKRKQLAEKKAQWNAESPNKRQVKHFSYAIHYKLTCPFLKVLEVNRFMRCLNALYDLTCMKMLSTERWYMKVKCSVLKLRKIGIICSQWT